MKYKKIAVIIADDYEYLPFLETMEKYSPAKGELAGYETAEFKIDSCDIFAVKCRIGKVNAAAAACAVCCTQKPDCIINTGLSGAVKGTRRGQVFYGSSFRECDFDLTALGKQKGEKPGQVFEYEADPELLKIASECHELPALACGTGDLFLTKASQKEEFHSLFGINTFDMETGAIASVCDSFKVPFLSVRKVSDDSEDSAAEDYKEMNDLKEQQLSQIVLDIILNLLRRE